MNWFVAALITGTVAFSATNIDDIVFLTIFFSQTRHKWHVVFGQYLGFTALVLVSLIGFFGGQLLPHQWLRLLGVAPIAIGIKKLFDNRDDQPKSARRSEEHTSELQSRFDLVCRLLLEKKKKSRIQV